MNVKNKADPTNDQETPSFILDDCKYLTHSYYDDLFSIMISFIKWLWRIIKLQALSTRRMYIIDLLTINSPKMLTRSSRPETFSP